MTQVSQPQRCCCADCWGRQENDDGEVLPSPGIGDPCAAGVVCCYYCCLPRLVHSNKRTIPVDAVFELLNYYSRVIR